MNVSGMVKNRKLSRAISDLSWRKFRTFLEGKAEKYGRDFIVISRWEPISYALFMLWISRWKVRPFSKRVGIFQLWCQARSLWKMQQ
ncbi:hypothetical protein [Okeania sp.]|uniref:hypothetical protein n=1 Tax=Okeania sp. TaxID=3100323 RepID=UPI002B4B50C9|nr:hypothetical protein [Okeania sp.]MEB3343370.1 hypothetical protein [Okeania sp.]